MSESKVFLTKYSRLLLLILILVALAFASPNFLSKSNLINVLRQSSMLLIMSLGMMFAMLLGRGVDMSIGSILSLTSCWSAFIMKNDVNNPIYTVLGIVVAIVVGVSLGIMNGAIIAYFRLPAILVTFGTREIIRGVAYLMMSDTVVTRIPKFVQLLGTGKWLSIPMPIWVALGFVILATFMLKHSRIGRRIYLVGANPAAAKFSGINVNFTIIFGFTMSALFATFAGLVYIGRLNAAEPQIGETFAFQCVSAVAIGGTSFNGGIGSAWGAVVGAIILSLLLNGMNLLNISSSWQGIVNGVMVILAVLLDYIARKQRN